MNDPEQVAEIRRWLRFARNDLHAAERLLTMPDIAPHIACFHAQQAAEKALKAALIVEQIEPPKIHSLDALRDLLPTGWRVHTAFPNLRDLSDWAMESRYPGEWPEATVDDARVSVEQARAVVESIRAGLGARGIT